MKTAMILAAGRGERLRPLTDIQPKALCTVYNVPLIEYHVANLTRAGFKRLIVNHAYLGGKIRQRLGNGERWGVEICYSPEPPGGLETGGGIVNALPLIGNKPFLTVNADIFTDYNFESLHLPKQSIAHLVLVHKSADQQHGDFGLSPTSQLDNVGKQYTFSGIACYHPALFNSCKPGRYSVNQLLRQLATNNQATGEIYAGMWFDIGSFQQLQLARRSRRRPSF